MKYKCKHKAIVGIHLYSKGDIAEFDEGQIDDQIRSSFEPLGGGEADGGGSAPREPATLTKREYMDRLTRMGVAFNVRDKLEDLKRKYDEQVNADARLN